MATSPFRDVVRDRFWLRAFIFLICIPSGGAVLTEVYGLVPMHDVVWFGAVPAYLILFGIWALNRKGPLSEISDGCCQSNDNLSPPGAGRAGGAASIRRASSTQPRRLSVGPCRSLC